EEVLDTASQAELEKAEDRTLVRKVEILQEFAARAPTDAPRRLLLRFLVSPVEIVGDASGKVAGLRLTRNVLTPDAKGALQAVATGETEELPVGLVFRSVGYRGVPLPGIPFDERRGVVPNERGRVRDPGGRWTLPGLYVSGWLKRGPSGVIGTNKPDAAETVAVMLEDAATGGEVEAPDPAAAEAFIRQCQPGCLTQAEWRRIDQLETSRGAEQGRPRVKFLSAEEAEAALRAPGAGS
ncbi:MAG TPA: hypothetical protein VD793_04025, partial [Gemmatimonadales bacterium]|nr:hypothetical protein [Gemmatimonadales bacterium]